MSKQTPDPAPAPVAVIVLAAGLGTRMKSELPKVLHPIAGRPMIQHLLASVDKLEPERVVVVASAGAQNVRAAVQPHPTAVQTEQRGTGHAVLQAKQHMASFNGDVLILFGGDPLITPKTMKRLLDRRRGDDDPAVVVLGFRPREPGLYGRLVVNGAGRLEAIVEARDATPEQLATDLCNSGAMAVDGKRLFDILERVGNNNAKGEFYLTDMIAIANGDGANCAVIEAQDPDELTGIDTRFDLAAAEAIVQKRLRQSAMANGATLAAPETVFFSHDTVLGRDVIVGPNVVFAPNVKIGNNVTILPFCHLEGATVADGVTIGPFARLRPGAVIGDKVNIGNFVEIKNATLGIGAKVNHLTYLGDARVGAGANVGAGTITCNYDGFFKHQTDIGARAFIGSNTALVAPLKVGEGAIVGAGSVIARDVPANALAVSRATQKQIEGWAEKFRSKKATGKNNKNEA